MTMAQAPVYLTLVGADADAPVSIASRRARAEQVRRVSCRETLLKRLDLIGCLAPEAQLSFVLVKVRGLSSLSWTEADDALRVISDRVLTLTRATDVVGRYAGASFGVVLQGTGATAAAAVAARLQFHLSQLAETLPPLSVNVSVATGTGVNARTLPTAALDSLLDCC